MKINVKRPGLPPGFGMKPTPQQKIIRVNDQAGNRGIQNQQGSTRILFDTIKLNPVAPQREFQFFKTPNQNGTVWGTNVDATNGLLGPGEAMALEYMSFCVITVETATGEIGDIQPVASLAAVNTFEFGFYTGTFEIDISNNKVMKPTALQNFLSDFNPSVIGPGLFKEVMELRTDLVVMPALPVIITVRVPVWSLTVAPGYEYYLRCTITGAGSLLNLKLNV